MDNPFSNYLERFRSSVKYLLELQRADEWAANQQADNAELRTQCRDEFLSVRQELIASLNGLIKIAAMLGEDAPQCRQAVEMLELSPRISEAMDCKRELKSSLIEATELNEKLMTVVSSESPKQVKKPSQADIDTYYAYSAADAYLTETHDVKKPRQSEIYEVLRTALDTTIDREDLNISDDYELQKTLSAFLEAYRRAKRYLSQTQNHTTAHN